MYYINKGSAETYSYELASDTYNPFSDVYFSNGGVVSVFVDLGEPNHDLESLFPRSSSRKLLSMTPRTTSR